MKIKNADLPAMPISNTTPSEIGADTVSEYVKYTSGLTKREHFAGLAMQAILSNPGMIDVLGQEDWVSKAAITQANSILAELEKQP